MSELRIKTAIDNGDLDPKQLDLFKDQEQKQLTLFPLSYINEINRKEQNDKFIFKTNIKF